MSTGRALVTGAFGCIGAWVVRALLLRGYEVVAYDLGTDPRRLRLVLTPDQLAAVVYVHGDITDLPLLERTLDEHRIDRIVHLAALQVPFCRANPLSGAAVNVLGTLNVLEAVKRRRDQIGTVVFASSAAAHPKGNDPLASPSTIYGVYKRANEGCALRYWEDYDVPSVGLRPHTVYGPGRDQGMTSAPTTALLAAAAGVPYQIPFTGSVTLQYAPDVADSFVLAGERVLAGAEVHDLGGDLVAMSEFVQLIDTAVPERAGTISAIGDRLPFRAHTDPTSLYRVLGKLPAASPQDGVRDAIQRFRELLSAGLVAVDRKST